MYIIYFCCCIALRPNIYISSCRSLNLHPLQSSNIMTSRQIVPLHPNIAARLCCCDVIANGRRQHIHYYYTAAVTAPQLQYYCAYVFVCNHPMPVALPIWQVPFPTHSTTSDTATNSYSTVTTQMEVNGMNHTQNSLPVTEVGSGSVGLQSTLCSTVVESDCDSGRSETASHTTVTSRKLMQTQTQTHKSQRTNNFKGIEPSHQCCDTTATAPLVPITF